MTKRRNLLQKISLMSAIASFVLAIISGVILYLRLESLGGDNPISASLMASIFFFICVGGVLSIIANANIPSFKVDGVEED